MIGFFPANPDLDLGLTHRTSCVFLDAESPKRILSGCRNLLLELKGSFPISRAFSESVCELGRRWNQSHVRKWGCLNGPM